MAVTGWDIDGTDLRTLAYDIRDTDDWDSFPASKYGVQRHPFRTGFGISDKTFYRERHLNLNMAVFPQNTSGQVTTSPLEHMQDNIDTLLGLFHSSGLLTITRTLPDGLTTRVIEGKVLNSFQVKQLGTFLKRFTVRLDLPYPFWRQGSVKNVNGTGALVLTNNGNAPIHNAVITFTTAGRLTVNATGDYIESSAAGVVVDLGAWTVTQGGSPADNLLSDYNRPWFVDFQPGANSLTATGTVSIDFYDSYL